MTCTGLTLWRQWRLPVLDFTVFDFGLFVLAVALLGEWLLQRYGGSRTRWWGSVFAVGMLLGILTHWALGIPTVVGWALGLNAYPARPTC